MNLEELIKILDKDLVVEEIERKEKAIFITCKKETNECQCPYCGEVTSSVHSRYVRTISDLPIQNLEVKLLLNTRKCFCSNPNCNHKTFSERYDFVEPKAVKTIRLENHINTMGLRDNSMDTVRNLKDAGINVSSNIVLRIVKKNKTIITYESKNIGIDDFSSKKREIYNTIIIDNDEHQKIEVINSREKDDVVKVLKKFSNVATVTRDFSLTYKNAISEAIPNAEQIVDRFHIFKNLTDDLCTYLKRNVKDRIKLVRGNDALGVTEVLTKRQQDKIDTANRKWQTIEEAKKLYAEGYTKTRIAKELGITRVTLNTYLTLTEPPVKDSECILDEYIPLIKTLIIERKKVKEIYETIKENGYKGKMTVLNMHMKSIRHEIKKQYFLS